MTVSFIETFKCNGVPVNELSISSAIQFNLLLGIKSLQKTLLVRPIIIPHRVFYGTIPGTMRSWR